MIYLDSSAVTKLITNEPGVAALVSFLDAEGSPDLVSSIVTETEVRRAATRRNLSQEAASAVLGSVSLAVLDREVCLEAGLLPGQALRSLDAIHVATAVRLRVHQFITYDRRQADAARMAGLDVVSPT